MEELDSGRLRLYRLTNMTGGIALAMENTADIAHDVASGAAGVGDSGGSGSGGGDGGEGKGGEGKGGDGKGAEEPGSGDAPPLLTNEEGATFQPTHSSSVQVCFHISTSVL